MTNDLTLSAVLSFLSISKWEGRKYDKKVSEKVAKDYGTTKEAGRYNKALVARDALKEINSVVAAIRAYHHEVTVPFGHGGTDLLPVVRFDEHKEKTNALIAKFKEAADEFACNYPNYIKQAELDLGGMHNRADYPRASSIRSKFSVTIEYNPVPAGDHLIVELANGELSKLQAQVEEQKAANLNKAMGELWSRLYEPVQKMAEALATPDKGFHKSLIENIKKVTAILPDLNLANDISLEKMAKEVEAKLCKHDTDELRLDLVVRQETAHAAKNILEKMDRALEF